MNRKAENETPRVAYLTSQYPATSHTFISREVAAMRQLGIKLETFSIRPPSNVELQDPQLRAEASTTFTVLRGGAGHFVSANLKSFFGNPLRYLQTFGLALRHRAPGIKGLLLSAAHFAEAIVLARELKRRDITHLHNHFANSAATVGYLASRFLRMDWSFTMHGISETDYPAGLLLGRKIEAASFVACVSYFGRAQAMRLVEPMHWDKLHIIRCGLPLEVINRPTKRRSTNQIICVGRLSPEKGHAGLLEAFATVAGEIPSLRLVLIGDGPDSAKLRAITRERELEGRVTFAGRLGEADTLDYIARSDILVLPSFMEGLPIVLMEAMAVGTAVIASRVAGIPELIEDNRNGLLFTPSNWDELALCIRRLAKDKKLQESLATAGRERLSVEFESHRSAERLLRLFRKEAIG